MDLGTTLAIIVPNAVRPVEFDDAAMAEAAAAMRWDESEDVDRYDE
jgi:hypothetical protein